jgi:hypothetical protein
MWIALCVAMNKRFLTATLLSFSLALAAGAPAALAAPPFVPGANARATTSEPARPSTRDARSERADDARRYAAAEQAQPAAADFEGGTTVVIFGSTAAVILLVVLLVILL